MLSIAEQSDSREPILWEPERNVSPEQLLWLEELKVSPAAAGLSVVERSDSREPIPWVQERAVSPAQLIGNGRLSETVQVWSVAALPPWQQPAADVGPLWL